MIQHQLQLKVELLDYWGSDRVIAESAWTSSYAHKPDEVERSDAHVARVVQSMANEGHAVPFESVLMRWWIRMPIATDRQWMTHRWASQNGMSGRYRTMPSDFLEMPDDVRGILQDAQLSPAIQNYEYMCSQANEFYNNVVKHLKEAQADHRITNVSMKRAREFIRGVLPQHNMTERVTTINLRSMANLIRLRDSSHAQPEIRQIAHDCRAIMQARMTNCHVTFKCLDAVQWRLDPGES